MTTHLARGDFDYGTVREGAKDKALFAVEGRDCAPCFGGRFARIVGTGARLVDAGPPIGMLRTPIAPIPEKPVLHAEESSSSSSFSCAVVRSAGRRFA